MEQLDPFKPVTQNFQKGTLVITVSIEVFFFSAVPLVMQAGLGPLSSVHSGALSQHGFC